MALLPKPRNVRKLHEEGVLHKKLLTRIRILTAIAALLFAAGLYEVVRDRLHLIICAVFALIAFALGVFLFARINPVVWDEEKEVITTGRIDIAGAFILVLYFLFDYATKQYLHAHYAHVSSITGYVLATLGGSLLGRSVGTRIAVYRLAHRQRDRADATAKDLSL